MDPEISDLVMLLPEKGAQNISINSELVWKNIDGVSKYEIQLSDQYNFSSLIVDLVVDSNRVELNGLPFDNKIYWRVRTLIEDEPGLWSQIFDFTTEEKSESSPPVATTLKSPFNHSVNQPLEANLEWTFVVNAINYQLQISTDANFENLFLEKYVDETEFLVSNFDLGLTYFWRVLAEVNGVETSWSETWVYSTETAPSSAINLVNPHDGLLDQPTTLTFLWTSLSGISNYNIQISIDNSFQSTNIDEVTSDTIYHTSGLDYGTTYFWRVRKSSNEKNFKESIATHFNTSANSISRTEITLSHDLPNKNEIKNKDWSEIWTFSTIKAPEPQVQLSEPKDNEDGLPTTVTLSWKKLSDIDEYQVQLAGDDSFSKSMINETILGTSYKITVLEYDKTYYWRVRANGSSDWSEVWSFQTEEASIPPVILTTPSNNSTDQPTALSLQWKEIDGITKYLVQVSKTNNFSDTIVNKIVSKTSYEVSNLQNDETYYWKVQAQGSKKWSEIWSFSTEKASMPNVQLSEPENNSVGLPTTLTLSWKKISGINEYHLQLSSNDTFSELIVDQSLNSASYKVEDLNNGQTYFWRVKVNENNSVWSNIWSFKTVETADIPKVELSEPENGVTGKSTTINLIWNEISGIEKYQVQLSTDNTFSETIVNKTVSRTSYPVTGLDHDKTYFWRVRAEGSSNWSDVWSFSTEEREPIPPVTLIAPTNNATNQPTELTLQWQKIDGVTGYQVQMSATNSFSEILINKTVSKNSYSTTDLDHNKSYFWRVRAEGGSDWSEVWSFSTEETSPIPPVTLIAPPNNSGDQPTNLTLQWEEIDEVTEYRVQVAKNNSFSNRIYNEIVNQSQFNINGLEEDQIYYWRVRAGESDEWSDIWSFTTKKPSSPPSDDFVQVSKGNFVIDGNVFRFAGTNAYYLPNYEKIDSRFVNNTLNTFEDTGITVIRMWAFYDGYDCGYSRQDSNENVIQTAPGEYSESALRDLDNVIAKGKERGIRFLLTFINYWDELGGICQYNTWDGASNPSTNMSHFISSSNTQKWFKDYIKMLLKRVNTVTGNAYKNEPAIFGWEIMNEGRFSGQDPKVLRDWYREMAQYIKSIDSNHLVTTGEEGFDEGTPPQYSVNQYSNTYVLRANEGTSYITNTAIPEIDFGSAHWYPSDWGFGYNFNQNLENAQHAWLNDHKEIAEDLGKPFVLGEYGYAGWGDQTVFNIYSDMWNHAENIKLDGSFLWQLTTDYVKCYEFGGNICWPEGRQDTGLYNSFKKHIQSIK